jgi:hypothetical protein
VQLFAPLGAALVRRNWLVLRFAATSFSFASEFIQRSNKVVVH